MIARALQVAIGLWLMVAPAVLGHAGELAGKADRTAGPIAASLAFVAMWAVVRALRWATLPVAAWLVVAPWLLDFPLAAAINDLACGLALGALAFARGRVKESYGGGWLALRHPRPGVG